MGVQHPTDNLGHAVRRRVENVLIGGAPGRFPSSSLHSDHPRLALGEKANLIRSAAIARL